MSNTKNNKLRVIKFIMLLLGVFFITTNYGIKNSEAEILFSDDFESGSLSKWTYAVAKATIVSSPFYSQSHALYIPYDIPAGPPAHQDNNRFVQVDMTSYNLDHFFVRGYVYIASTTTPSIQRKLYYIFSSPHSGVDDWDVVLSVWGTSAPLGLCLVSNNYSYSDLRIPIYNIAYLNYDTWYGIELEVKPNTPGIQDGEVRVWVNGSKAYERTSISIRNNLRPVGIVRIGAQIDKSGDELARHEDRYWDDIAIGTSYLGPVSTTRPFKPTILNVQ
jgi:hypothetical protein